MQGTKEVPDRSLFSVLDEDDDPAVTVETEDEEAGDDELRWILPALELHRATSQLSMRVNLTREHHFHCFSHEFMERWINVDHPDI